jgi:hypothetical protein
MADWDVFSTPVTVSSCAVGNERHHGAGLVSFARGLVIVIGSIVSVIGSAAMQSICGAEAKLAEPIRHGFQKRLVLHQGLNLA